jgi:HD superfamily phosphodiesterase
MKENEFNGEIIGIQSDTFEEELDKLLEKLGLNERERNDFIVYWIKDINRHDNIAIRIEDSRYDEAIPLKVEGFDQIHRVFVIMKNVTKSEQELMIKNNQVISKESLKLMKRPEGKYIIEWNKLAEKSSSKIRYYLIET